MFCLLCLLLFLVLMPSLSPRLEVLFQFGSLLLLFRSEGLVDLGKRLATDRGQLSHLTALGCRELLDLSSVVGLDRVAQRLTGLHQLLPDRLSRLPGVLKDRLGLRLLCVGQVELSRHKRARSSRMTTAPVMFALRGLGREEACHPQSGDGGPGGKLITELHGLVLLTIWTRLSRFGLLASCKAE